MIQLKSLRQTPQSQIRALGWNWMVGKDTLSYITEDVVVVSQQQAEAYGYAANTLYEMLVEAGQHVIDNNLFDELAIPANLVEMIRLSWEDDRNLHLYGRFDFSGGIQGLPIKLIEFNADTATCLPETAVVQWAHLKANGLDETLQFNSLYECLTDNFRRLLELNDDLEPTLLLSCFRDHPEDAANVELLSHAAEEAGFTVDFRYIDEVEFSAAEGIFAREDNKYYSYNFWFKLVPWEFIAFEEPELLDLLYPVVRNRRAVVINPAYTMLFQSKGILKVLWDLFPHHPLLLETATKPLAHKEFYVEKVMFGREGANVSIYNQKGQVLARQEGEYGEYPSVFQEYAEFPKDYTGNSYQAGVFFAYEACALGFRRGGRIIGNTAQFAGHLIS